MNTYKAVIIDDEIWTRQVIRSLGHWEEHGIEIAGEASDGEYGLELIRQVQPDILITDVCMPQMNGLELVEKLREQDAHMQIIFISGYDDYSYVRSAMKLGVVDYLLKPVKEEELNHQLQICIQKLSDYMEAKSGDKLSAGFLKEEWAEEYYRRRDELSDVLNSMDERLIADKLRSMQLFLTERMSDKPDKGSMICIYYMLLNILQRFILSRDYKPAEIFGEKNTVFVFSAESSPKSMMDFLSDLFLHATETMQDLSKCRNRLDIARIKRYMEEHYKEGITLEETAAEFYVSKEYLSKAFKQSTGRGFTEYITALRMEKAKELLVEYRVPIKEVCEMVGYVDQAHFYKTFKKYHGITPGEMKPV